MAAHDHTSPTCWGSAVQMVLYILMQGSAVEKQASVTRNTFRKKRRTWVMLPFADAMINN
ncbi:hypothetical protein VTO42DRAFT_2134 [Malbranchea cinnamomea]